MALPAPTYFPTALDTDDNLFVVHDALRMTLAEDYNPGDTSISLDGDPNVLANFPPSGEITLTEQCSDIDERAISFYYSNVDPTNFVISGLVLLPHFNDVVKPKRITNVTLNVTADHHNHLKDALIAIENFIGVRGTLDPKPLGSTLEGRINFLRKLVLTPKAYFSADRRIGLVPLTVNFKDLSFRTGTDGTTGEITYLWDFGDNTISSVSSTISATSVVSINEIDVLVDDLDGDTISKTFSSPGVYTVTLTVSNKYGSDTIVWPDLIHARAEAPQEAVVNFVTSSSQILTQSGSPSGGPYITTPVVRTPVNTFVTLQIPSGENSSNPGYSYVGEKLTTGGQAIDPVVNYTWSLGDDLNHNNLSSSTKASYSIGGLYDMKLRVDTEFGAYRITTYPAAIDVVEKSNLWLWVFTNSTDVVAYEFGLLSETFKVGSNPSYTVSRDSSFLQSESNSAQMIQEFNRNVGLTPRSTTASGNGGDSLIYYASGRGSGDPISLEEVKFVGFNGFTGTYDLGEGGFTRPWNWASLSSSANTYFLLGSPTTSPASNTSPANPSLTTVDLVSLGSTSVTLTSSNFLNGADELLNNVAQFDGSGNNIYGNFSVYRTAWKGQTGYIARNDGVGQFFRLKSFYKTQGTVGNPVQSLAKLIDMPSRTPAVTEGELVSLTGGLYFFNNSGSISSYDDSAGIWETTGPSTNATSFRLFQDTSVSGFDNLSNTLLAASDGDRLTYLSFDYSSLAFTRFNSGSLTFTSLSSRPVGSQWVMSIY